MGEFRTSIALNQSRGERQRKMAAPSEEARLRQHKRISDALTKIRLFMQTFCHTTMHCTGVPGDNPGIFLTPNGSFPFVRRFLSGLQTANSPFRCRCPSGVLFLATDALKPIPKRVCVCVRACVRACVCVCVCVCVCG